MSYTAPNRLLMPARHSIETYSAVPEYAGGSTAAVWPSANLAIYVPIPVSWTIVVRKLWISSGATGTGNFDLGIYNAGGTKLVSTGATAKVASSTEQVVDITDTTLTPGLYWLALASDSGTDTFYRFSMTAPIPAAVGILSQTSAYTLPATATWALDQALTYAPVCGMLLETTVA